MNISNTVNIHILKKTKIKNKMKSLQSWEEVIKQETFSDEHYEVFASKFKELTKTNILIFAKTNLRIDSNTEAVWEDSEFKLIKNKSSGLFSLSKLIF